MRHTLRLTGFLLVAIFACLVVAACGSSSTSTQAGVSGTRIEVTKLPPSVQEMSAYEIVRQYKSSWLEGRGRTSINRSREVSVYLSTQPTRFGGPESLTQLLGRNIRAIEYLSSQEAQFRFGLDNPRGAILVEMKKGR